MPEYHDRAHTALFRSTFPDPKALHSQHCDVAKAGRAGGIQRGLVAVAGEAESNMAKVIASEAAVNAADLRIQILGGMGYSAETDAQRYWRGARLFRIGPVTNEMARNGIAKALGLPRSF
jgi:alkylation response protein AidB-like acyl-CoA dehydrogenase